MSRRTFKLKRTQIKGVLGILTGRYHFINIYQKAQEITEHILLRCKIIASKRIPSG